MSSLPIPTGFGPYGFGYGLASPYGAFGGGYGWHGRPVAEEVPAAKGDDKPAKGEQTARQDKGFPLGAVSGGGFDMPGFPPPPPAGMPTWRMMSKDPVIAISHMTVAQTVLNSVRTVEPRLPPGKKRTKGPVTGDGVISDPLDARAEYVAAQLDPFWHGLMINCVRAIRYQIAAFEVVREAVAGDWRITKFKQLLPDYPQTQILVRPNGELAGLKNFDKQLLGPDAFLYTYGSGESVDLYGQSRLANCLPDWWRKQKFLEQAFKISQKAGGVQPIVKYPDGTYTDELGKVRSGYETAVGLINGLRQGMGAAVRNMSSGIDADDMRNGNFQKLLESSLWDITDYNSGDHGPAMGTLLEWSRYLDSMIAMGYLCPPRAAQESQKGGGLGASEAGAHEQVGAAGAEMVHAEICEQLSQSVVNDTVRIKFGRDAVNSVYIKAHSSAESQSAADDKMVTALMANGQLASQVFAEYDLDSAFERSGYTKRPKPLVLPMGGAVPPAGDTNPADEAKPPAKPAAGTPPANGKGRLAAIAGGN